MDSAKKVILITGASSGIGLATATLLLQNGHTVYAAARRVEKMEPLKQIGGKVIAVDVTKDDDLISAVDLIIAEQGRIDVLFNNAGYGSYGAVEDVPLYEAKRQFDVNLFSTSRLTQLVLPHMRAQNSGLIINNSSMGGRMFAPMGAWYHATKYAIEGFSDCLRFEAKPFGIKLVIIEPGNIKSAWYDIMLENLKSVSDDGAYSADVKGCELLMNRIGKFSPTELIARTVLKAINAKNPKTRYLVGKNAKLFVFLRNFLPDKMYDSVMRWLINNLK